MAAILHLAVADCANGAGLGGRVVTAGQLMPGYRGSRSERLNADLVRDRVEMTDAPRPGTLSDPAECASAGYAWDRGYGCVRHIRTDAVEANGIWTGDVVWTISAVPPAGARKVDAEVVTANCREKGIPPV